MTTKPAELRMKKTTKTMPAMAARVALAALVAALAACGGGDQRAATTPAPAPAPDATAVDPALLTEIAAGLEEVLSAMAQIAANPDCAAMGAELTQLFDRSQPLFVLARTQGENPEAAQLLTAAMDARAARVGPMVETIGPGLERCRNERSVIDAMTRMPTF